MLSLYERIRVSENPYSRIFYVVTPCANSHYNLLHDTYKHKANLNKERAINTMFPLYEITIIAFQPLYQIDILFPQDLIIQHVH